MPSTTVELRIEGGEIRPPQADYWFGAGAALLAFAVAVTIARQRTRAAGFEPPRRLPRVLQPSLLFSGTITFWLVCSELQAPAATGPLPLIAALAFLAFLVIGLILFSIVEFWLGRARPRRTRSWLYLGMAVFASAIGAAVAATMIAGGAAEDIAHPLNLAIVAIAAACGMVWWAYLPPTHPDTVRVFE